MANTFETEYYDQKPWWVDYDGDIEEEKYKIEERILREIEDPEEQLNKIQLELEALEYDDYFAYNPQFKSETSLIILRNDLKNNVPEDVSIYDFITLILHKSNMVNCGPHEIENILTTNFNKKFTFLNSIKDIYDYDKMVERGLKK